jgi:hypothetical protein
LEAGFPYIILEKRNEDEDWKEREWVAPSEVRADKIASYFPL